MAITLPEARFHLRDSVLYCGTTFAPSTLDMALVRSGIRLMQEGGLNKGYITADTVADNREVNWATDNPAFSQEWCQGIPFVSPSNGTRPWARIQPVSLDNLRAEFDKSGTTSGRPQLMHWIKPAVAWYYPIPDAVYTLIQPVNTPLSSNLWSPGTHETGEWASGTTYRKGDVISSGSNAYRSKDNENTNNTPTGASDDYWTLLGTTTDVPVPASATSVTFNIPDLYVYDWIGTGAVADVLRHAPGHETKIGPANREFEALIERASDASATAEGPWYVDPYADRDTAYGPQSLPNM